MTARRPAIFLDRDGVVIENRSAYVLKWGDVSFLPGVFDAMRVLSDTSFVTVMITNQSAIGRGLITLQEAEEINQRVISRIEAHGGRVDAFYMCVHRPGEGCSCRKPSPGMLVRAAQELGLDLSASFLVGDARSDIEAGRAAGAQPILVLTGRGSREAAKAALPEGCMVVPDLSHAVSHIVGTERSLP